MAQPAAHVTYEEYLAREERSETKHEYAEGAIFDMAGGTPDHAALQMAVGSAFANALRGKPCRVFSSDLRVRIEASNRAVYPDVTIVCGALETSPKDKNAATNPTVIVEVTSESSDAYDRGAKFRHYRRVESLREYVLLAHDEPGIEVWRRNERGRWELAEEAMAGGRVRVAAIDATLEVDDVYADPLARG